MKSSRVDHIAYRNAPPPIPNGQPAMAEEDRVQSEFAESPPKQPVYIRSDFNNVYTELTGHQIERLIEFVRELEKENG